VFLPAFRSLILLAVVLGLATGCVSLRKARKKVDGDLVQSVHFEGAAYGQQELLRAQMAQKVSGFGVRLPLLKRLVRPVAYDPALLEEDTYRVETWLAHQGWFDAELTGWRVERRRPQRLRRDGSIRKAGVVTIVGQLDRGPMSVVREFRFDWTDDQSPRATQRNMEGTVLRNGFVVPEQQFSLDLAEYTRAYMLATVRDTGHAYATVGMAIDAYPAQQVVDVILEASSGPVTTVGPIRVYGNEKVRTEDILELLELEEGASTRQRDLAQAQQNLVSTGVFPVARVEPNLSDPTVSAVPIDVSVSEGRFGTFRVGGGVVYDGTSVSPRTRVEVKHLNIDGRLARFEGAADFGAGIPLVGGLSSTKLVGGFELGVTKPRAFGVKNWDTNGQLSFKRDLIASQLLYTRARLLWGVSWRASDDVSISIGPSIEFARLGSGSIFSSSAALTSDDALIAAATFGSTGKNPYLLTLMEARLTADWRDEAVSGQDASLDAKAGYYYNVVVRQAVPLSLGGLGQFEFTDLYGEARTYRSPLGSDGTSAPLTLAARLKVKWLPSLRGADLRQSVPYADRAFLGGTLDMRGFRQRQVGAYDCVCLSREEPIRSGILPIWPFAQPTGVTRLEPNPTYLPRGGRFSWLVSTEARRRWRSGNTFSAFADAGVLGATLEDLLRLDRTLRWDVGVGYRRATPVGPIRIDLAVRPGFGEDLGPLRDEGTFNSATIDSDDYFRGTTYGCDPFPDARLPRRVPGLFISNQLGRALPPVVFNLSIAIGEAF
jgi:outer membrane protein assembly factor BamA